MTREEERQYIAQYLDQYRKGLSPAQTERIVPEEQNANPLYLRTLLEELRIFGIHEELDRRIEHYLQATTVEGLFDLVLQRLEKDYERERTGLVRDVTTLIWASRRGLTESEILDILQHDGAPMPRSHWSPLHLALEESLVSRTGLLSFFHDFLKKAVEARYLQSQELKQNAHITIADYFDKREVDDRKVDELPWQLSSGESWQRLKNCVTDMEMFLKLRTEEKPYELTGYWLSMGERFDMAGAYNDMIERYERSSADASQLADRINGTATFLHLNARYQGAEPLYRSALAIREKVLGPEHPDTSTSLNNLAGLLDAKGDYEGAEPLYRRALAISEKVLGPEHPDTSTSLNNVAEVCKTLNKRALELLLSGLASEAEPLMRRALATEERIYPEDHPKLPHRINNLASVLLVLDRPAEAQELLARALKLKQGRHDITSTRILFNRLGVAVLAGEMADSIIGRLKTLLLLGERQTTGNVSSRSQGLECVVKSLRERGVPDIEFLEALGSVVNGDTPANDLDRFPTWREQAPVSLDTPWQEKRNALILWTDRTERQQQSNRISSRLHLVGHNASQSELLLELFVALIFKNCAARSGGVAFIKGNEIGAVVVWI